MDPFDRFDIRRRKVNVQAIIAFVLGVVVAYVLQFWLRFGGSALLTALIVIAVGGFWYHIRRVV